MEDLGDSQPTARPILIPDPPETRMQVLLTKTALGGTAVFVLGEVLAATLDGSTALPVSLTFGAGLFSGLLLQAAAFWFSGPGG